MSTKRSAGDAFASYRNAVRVELEAVIETCPPSLRTILRYHMGWQDKQGRPSTGESGKFVRSTLCLLGCQAIGSDTAQAVPAAAAVELLHNFSLIHDDIEDASSERHHRPTVWEVWGESQAINAGDAMFTLAYLALPRLKEKGIADQKIARTVEMLGRACLELCEGQYLDVDYESRLDVTVEDYLDMADKKTAALFAASTSLGAYLGGGGDKLVDRFRLFGRKLGTAYQIYDDVLGIWGTEERVGKSAGDIAQRKKSLPVVYGLRNSDGETGKRLGKLYRQKSIKGDDVKEVTEILERSGAREYAANLAGQYYRKALVHLEATRLDASRQAPLKEMACSLVDRDF
jgi:geranylgeranyl diphosphate synthase, type I